MTVQPRSCLGLLLTTLAATTCMFACGDGGTSSGSASNDESNATSAPPSAQHAPSSSEPPPSSSTSDPQQQQQPTKAAAFPRLLVTSLGVDRIRKDTARSPTKEGVAALFADAQQTLSHVPTPPSTMDVPAYYQDRDGHRAGKRPIQEDGLAAYTLALAYQVEQNAATRASYAKKAEEILDAWASVNKEVTGPDGNLVMMYRGSYLVLAGDLVMDDPSWPGPSKQLFLNWTEGVFRASADEIKDRPNNWGAWGHFGAIAAARLRGDSVAEEVQAIKKYIDEAINDDGELPEENKRHVKGMWYTFFALSPLTNAAFVAKNAGADDLFAYVSPNHHSIKLALDRYFFYADDPSRWPYTKPTDPLEILQSWFSPQANEIELPTKTDWPANLFGAMGAVYHDKTWSGWGAAPVKGGELLTYSTVLCPAFE